MRLWASILGTVALLVCLTVPAGAAQDGKKSPEELKKHCLECHGKKGRVKEFPDGAVSTYVDPKAFAKSVHGALACNDCHQEFSEDHHPDRAFRNKMQYRAKVSRRCRDCHPENTIKSRAVHEDLFRRERAGETLICTNCHSAHAVTRVSAGHITNSEERHCLGCHGREIRMVFANGESVSVQVHAGELKGSPHRNIACSDCHFGFSVDEHPKKRFRTEREYRLSSSEICRQCHYDKYTKVAEGIHYAMLSRGKQEAPTCIDCHGWHAVSSPGKDRLSIVRKCQSCHKDAYAQYARSVHGSALFSENNRDVPICIDCHSSHSIGDPSASDFHDNIPDKCSKCHANKTLMGKYGLSTDVVKTYLSDFHGVTLSFYKTEGQKRHRPSPAIAVCTDCHGSHDITRVSGTDSQALKGTLLKRCQTCHPEATENFPDAWLSHYRASMTVAPAVFIVERFYGILLPVIVIGLLFQIVLDIWRYLSNR